MEAHFEEVRGQWEERFERRYGFLESLPMVAPPSLAGQNRRRLSSPLRDEDVVTRFFPGKEQYTTESGWSPKENSYPSPSGSKRRLFILQTILVK
jgi:hypothetical protein